MNKQTDEQVVKYAGRRMGMQTDGQTDRCTCQWMSKQMDEEVDKWTGRHMNRNTVVQVDK